MQVNTGFESEHSPFLNNYFKLTDARVCNLPLYMAKYTEKHATVQPMFFFCCYKKIVVVFDTQQS